ncbi:MAG: hypothetical protein ABIP53_00700 [Candidatus Limnocylindrales bacterium]
MEERVMRPNPVTAKIDWVEVAHRRAAQLQEVAAEEGVAFSPPEVQAIVAITLRKDANQAAALATMWHRLTRGW